MRGTYPSNVKRLALVECTSAHEVRYLGSPVGAIAIDPQRSVPVLQYFDELRANTNTDEPKSWAPSWSDQSVQQQSQVRQRWSPMRPRVTARHGDAMTSRPTREDTDRLIGDLSTNPDTARHVAQLIESELRSVTAWALINSLT